jgi:hypothetical protein
MKPTIAQIIAAVADEFNVSADDIVDHNNRTEFSRPRFIVCKIAHDIGYSYPQIGQRLGNRNHTTVRDGALRVETIAAQTPSYAKKYRDLIARNDWEFSSTKRRLKPIRIDSRVRLMPRRGGTLMGNLSQSIVSLEEQCAGAGHWILDQVPTGATLTDVIKSIIIDAYLDEKGNSQ